MSRGVTTADLAGEKAEKRSNGQVSQDEQVAIHDDVRMRGTRRVQNSARTYGILDDTRRDKLLKFVGVGVFHPIRGGSFQPLTDLSASDNMIETLQPDVSTNDDFEKTSAAILRYGRPR